MSVLKGVAGNKSLAGGILGDVEVVCCQGEDCYTDLTGRLVNDNAPSWPSG
jgi:hypothetical protein